jgi:hypothetical protein
MSGTSDRRVESESVDYIDCDVPRDMTLRDWRPQPAPRGKRLRAAAAALGRAARLRRRAG